MMVPDSFAFLLLCEDVYSEAIVDSMEGVNTNLVRLTVGDQLSGELAQFTAAQASIEVGGGVGEDQ